jgi:hypothetical protein
LDLKETWLKKRTFEANNYIKKVICEPNYSHFKSKLWAALGKPTYRHVAPTHARDAFINFFLFTKVPKTPKFWHLQPIEQYNTFPKGQFELIVNKMAIFDESVLSL